MLENKRILRYSDEEMAYLNYKKENGYYNFNDIKSDQEVLYKGLEDFVLTHKTDFLPDNDIIKTKKSTGYENGKHFSIKLGDKEYKYIEYHGRNTIHFLVNGEVMFHELGNRTKYRSIDFMFAKTIAQACASSALGNKEKSQSVTMSFN